MKPKAYPTVLVTGAAGRLGQEVVPLLRAHGYHVIGADLLPSPTTDVLLDVRNADAVRDATRSVNAIIHTAALHGKHTDMGVPRLEFVRTNIEGTLNLLNACQAHGIGKLLYTSTTSIYGQAMEDARRAVWVTEELVPQPRDIYDITKQTAEALCRNFFEKEGVQTAVLRVSRFLPEPANLAANHRLYRGLDARDGALGHLLALEHEFGAFDVFNISGGSPFEPVDAVQLKRDAASLIQQRLPAAAATYERLGWQLPASIDRVYSSEKAARVLGYQPQYTFQHLLDEAAAAHR